MGHKARKKFVVQIRPFVPPYWPKENDEAKWATLDKDFSGSWSIGQDIKQAMTEKKANDVLEDFLEDEGANWETKLVKVK